MDQVRIIPNQLAHFRDDISIVQLHGLRHSRDWLAARPRPAMLAAVTSTLTVTLEPVTVKSEARVYSPRVEVSGKYEPLYSWLRQYGFDNKKD